MDARKSTQRIVALLAASILFASPARAELTTVYAQSFDLPIPAEPHTGDAWMDDAVVNVPDSFEVIDLDIGITLTHTSVFDLQLFLTGPDGTRVTLNYYDPADEFFEGENYTATVFDDQALDPINSAEPPFTGRFKPRPPAELSVFNGIDPQGQWRLQIYDAWQANTGTLEKVSLIFNIPEPATFLLLLTALPFLRKRRDISVRTGVLPKLEALNPMVRQAHHFGSTRSTHSTSSWQAGSGPGGLATLGKFKRSKSKCPKLF